MKCVIDLIEIGCHTYPHTHILYIYTLRITTFETILVILSSSPKKKQQHLEQIQNQNNGTSTNNRNVKLTKFKWEFNEIMTSSDYPTEWYTSYTQIYRDLREKKFNDKKKYTHEISHEMNFCVVDSEKKTPKIKSFYS